MSTDNLDPDRLAQQARDIGETLAGFGVNACPIPEGVRRVCTELHDAHHRVDETSLGDQTTGWPLRARIDALITKLSWEKTEFENTMRAVAAERDAAQALVKAAEFRRTAAEYRDALGKSRQRSIRIASKHPPPHAKYLVRRDGTLVTATPCYGMHAPWWVVTTLDGEAPPVPMEDADEWEPVPGQPK